MDRGFYFKNLPKPTAYTKMETVTALLNLTLYTYCLHTTIGQALGQVNAGVNLNTAAVNIDIIAS